MRPIRAAYGETSGLAEGGHAATGPRSWEHDDMSLGEFFWSLLVIYAMFFYFMILFRVIGDLFSDQDTSGVMKTVWLIALVLLPFISIFVYLITRGPP